MLLHLQRIIPLSEGPLRKAHKMTPSWSWAENPALLNAQRLGWMLAIVHHTSTIFSVRPTARSTQLNLELTLHN